MTREPTRAPKATEEDQAAYKKYIREVPDFPKPGISFKDISPLLGNGKIFGEVVNKIADICGKNSLRPEIVACPEARGFIFGAALAYRLGVGFIPIRKPGKLPYLTSRVQYALEYGTDTVEMHIDAVTKGQRVLLVDDLLATGGTTSACADLVEKSGAVVAGCVFLVELTFLGGRKRLSDYPTFSLIRYQD
jgi:adenine phosphoribosyltransferase